MKKILLICFIGCSLTALSQPDTARKIQQHPRPSQQQKDSLYRALQVAEKKKLAKDSMAIQIEAELKIPRQKATDILNIIEQTATQMTAQARDRSLSSDEKTARLKGLAAKRDQQIGALLTEKQVQQLQEIMKKNREKHTMNR
jgi:hypothetical protein